MKITKTTLFMSFFENKSDVFGKGGVCSADTNLKKKGKKENSIPMPFSDDVLNKEFAQILSLKDRDYLQIEICIILKELLTPSKFD